MIKTFLILSFLVQYFLFAQAQTKIIDMHIHSYTDSDFGDREPAQRYIKEFLRNVKEAGYLDRIMFGSDQMIWPYAIEKSIRFLNSFDLPHKTR